MGELDNHRWANILSANGSLILSWAKLYLMIYRAILLRIWLIPHKIVS
jgi:hypothetical protein